jgi:hypothetical protein
LSVTVLHLKSKAGPDGKVEFDTGMPGADVDIVASVKPKVSDEQWKKEMGELLDSLGEVHLERLPRKPMRDRWSDE